MRINKCKHIATNVIRRVLIALYVAQPKSGDFMMAIIGVLFGYVFYTVQTATPTTSPFLYRLYSIMPYWAWTGVFVSYGLWLFTSTARNARRQREWASLLGLVLWTFITTYLVVLHTSPTAIVIYGVFALFSFWSYLNVREERRLVGVYGKIYKDRTLAEQTLKELIDLRERVEKAQHETPLTDAHDAHANHADNAA